MINYEEIVAIDVSTAFINVLLVSENEKNFC